MRAKVAEFDGVDLRFVLVEGCYNWALTLARHALDNAIILVATDFPDIDQFDIGIIGASCNVIFVQGTPIDSIDIRFMDLLQSNDRSTRLSEIPKQKLPVQANAA